MKIQLYPEDLLLEYTEKLLEGETTNPDIKYSGYFDAFPPEIDFSEEFCEKWQQVIEPVVKKFICDSFAFYPFLFESDGYTRKYSVTDVEFWESIDISFSQRSALRLYERMISDKTKQLPDYILSLPGDAVFLSIATTNFNLYSFPWLEKNKANWVIKALYATWNFLNTDEIPWEGLLAKPKTVELPLRGYLIDRAAVYMRCVNYILERIAEKQVTQRSELKKISAMPGCGVPLKLYLTRNPDKIIKSSNKFIKMLEKAVSYWTAEGMCALDDDRFINGVFNSSGIKEELKGFDEVVTKISDTNRLEERVDESVVFS
ncbi:MAG: hypothetical protein ACQETH_10715 [Candidatus Rifleibacteriota bacterium]